MKWLYDFWDLIKNILEIFPKNIQNHGVFGIFIDAFIIMFAFGIIDVIWIFISSFLEIGAGRREGEKYEKYVAKKLSKLGCVFRNVIMPSESTPIGKTEADMVLVVREGIFCIECKHRNYRDTLWITMNEPVWGQSEQNPISNPIVQNMTHIEALKKIVGEEDIFNMITLNFSYKIRATDSLIDTNIAQSFRIESIFIIRIDSNSISDGFKGFKKQLKGMPEKYTVEEVEKIKDAIKPYVADKAARKEFKKAQETYDINKKIEQERMLEAIKAEQKRIAKEKKKNKKL